jgi:hypothetical protein
VAACLKSSRTMPDSAHAANSPILRMAQEPAPDQRGRGAGGSKRSEPALDAGKRAP